MWLSVSVAAETENIAESAVSVFVSAKKNSWGRTLKKYTILSLTIALSSCPYSGFRGIYF